MNADKNIEDKFENIVDNINTIYEELKRQFNVQEGVFNKYNRTLEVMMGFIGIIITYMVTQKDFFQIVTFKNTVVVGFFCVGLLLVVLSAFFSFLAYRQRDFHVGPEVKEFLKKYAEKASYNFKLALFHEIYDSNLKNQEMLELKGKLMKKSYIILGIGFLLILITKTIYYLCIVYNG